LSSPLCSNQLTVRRTGRGPTHHLSLPLCNIKGDLCDVRNMVQVSRLREVVRGRARPGSNHQSRSLAGASRSKTCQALRAEDHRRRIVGDSKHHARAAEHAQAQHLGLRAKSPPTTKLQGLTLDAVQVQKYNDAETLALKRSSIEDCRAAVAAISSKPLLVVPLRADSASHKCSTSSPPSTPDIAMSRKSELQMHTISPDKVPRATGICIQSMSEATEITEAGKSCDPPSCGVPSMDCSDDSLSSSIDSGTCTIARPVSGVKVFVRPRSAPAGIAGRQRRSRLAVASWPTSAPMKH